MMTWTKIKLLAAGLILCASLGTGTVMAGKELLKKEIKVAEVGAAGKMENGKNEEQKTLGTVKNTKPDPKQSSKNGKKSLPKTSVAFVKDGLSAVVTEDWELIFTNVSSKPFKLNDLYYLGYDCKYYFEDSRSGNEYYGKDLSKHQRMLAKATILVPGESYTMKLATFLSGLSYVETDKVQTDKVDRAGNVIFPADAGIARLPGLPGIYGLTVNFTLAKPASEEPGEDSNKPYWIGEIITNPIEVEISDKEVLSTKISKIELRENNAVDGITRAIRINKDGTATVEIKDDTDKEHVGGNFYNVSLGLGDIEELESLLAKHEFLSKPSMDLVEVLRKRAERAKQGKESGPSRDLLLSATLASGKSHVIHLKK